MPRLPVTTEGYTPQGNAPRINPRTDVAATPRVVNAAEGLGELVGAAANSVQVEARKRDELALLESERKYAELNTQLLYGDDDKPGALRLEGTNAFGAHKRGMADWDREAARHSPRMLTPDGQKALERARLVRREDLDRRLRQHEAEQDKVAFTQGLSASIETYQNEAAIHYNDPAMVEASLARGRNLIAGGAKRLGMTPEATTLSLAKFESSTLRGVAERLLRENPFAAADYLEREPRILPEDRLALQDKIRPVQKDAEMFGLAQRVKKQGWAAFDAQPPADYAEYRRRLESGDNPTAKNPNSSAYGPDQFIAKTWLQMVDSEKPAWADGLSRSDLLALRSDPDKSAEMAAALDASTMQALTAAGLPVTNANLYASHHFGEAKGLKFAAAPDDMPMSRLLTEAELDANPYLRGKTKAQAIANWDKRAGMDAGKDAAPPASKGEALAIVNALALPEDRERAAHYVASLFDQEDSEREVVSRAASEAIYTKVYEAKGSGRPLSQVLTPDEFVFAKRKDMANGLDEMLKPGADDTPGLGAAGRFDMLAHQAAMGDRKALRELLAVDPYDVAANPRLSRDQRNSIAADQRALAGKDPRRAADMKGVAEIVDRALLQSLGHVDSTPAKGSRQATERRDFVEKLTAAIKAFPARHGRQPTMLEAQVMADFLLLDRGGSTRVFHSGTRIFQDGANASRLVVPAEHRRQILAEMPNASEAQIVSAYAEWKRRFEAPK